MRDGRRATGAVALAVVAVVATVAKAAAPVAEPVSRVAFHVDAVGGRDDADGRSPEQAWATLTRAAREPLRPGDALLLARGSTWASELRLDSSGTADAPITVAAYGNGAAPVIRAGRCVTVAGSHVVIRDLRVEECAWAGISVSGSYNRIEDTLVTANVAGLYVRAGARENRIVGNQVIGNDRMSVVTPESDGDDSGAFGILLHGDDNEVAGNVISGSDAFSWDYGRDGAAVEVYGGRRNRIHHNLALENNMFSELGNRRSADNSFEYNVVRSSLPAGGFLTTRGARSRYGPVRGTQVSHNSVLLTGASSQGIVCYAGCGPDILVMRDNAVQAAWKAAYADAPFDESHNLFWGGRVEMTLSATSRRADPGFVEPDEGNLRPAPSSPAVDAGSEVIVGRDFNGTVVPADGDGDGRATADIGAFERPKPSGGRGKVEI